MAGHAAGIAIALTALSINLIGDWLCDYLAPPTPLENEAGLSDRPARCNGKAPAGVE
ncbi:MAG: hypothetical protein MI924_26875 [Chloroflexales bacterium]|nr:hypothetical protein [Chloroflexales bacterium]